MDACFEVLSDKEKAMLKQHMVEVTYKKGETICKQGSFATHIMFLNEGLAKIYLEGQPKNLILKIAPSRHLIGLPSIYEGNNTFLYSAATYVDSVVGLIDINVFKRLLRQNSEFASKIISILNENTVQTYGRFYCLTQKQLHGRLADILLCLSQRVFKEEQFNLPLSRMELAELTGMSTESVIRVIKDFKDEGLIRINGKRFEIANYDRLVKISEIG
jgi:CRP/FNR family transcriptional regulator